MKGSKNLLSLGATAAFAAAAAFNATPPPPHTVGPISKNPPKNWLITHPVWQIFPWKFQQINKISVSGHSLVFQSWTKWQKLVNVKIDKLTVYIYFCNSLANFKMKRLQLPETDMVWICWNLIENFVKLFHLNFLGGFNLRRATVHHHAGRIASAQIQPPTFLSIPIILRQTNEFCPTHSN